MPQPTNLDHPESAAQVIRGLLEVNSKLHKRVGALERLCRNYEERLSKLELRAEYEATLIADL